MLGEVGLVLGGQQLRTLDDARQFRTALMNIASA